MAHPSPLAGQDRTSAALETVTRHFLPHPRLAVRPIERLLGFRSGLWLGLLRLSVLMAGRAPWEGYLIARSIPRASHSSRVTGAHDQEAQETTPWQYAVPLANARL